MWWIRQGCKIRKNCNIYYSCHVEKHNFGFVVGRSLRRIVSGLNPVAKIYIKAKFHNISLFCEHAPTELNNGAVKDAFYANLDLYDKCPAHDIKLVLGEFNPKAGQEGIFGSTVGQFSSLHSTTGDFDNLSQILPR